MEINQSQRASMKFYEKYSNVTQHGSKSMNPIKKQWTALMCFWKHHYFLVRASDSDLHVREAQNPSQWLPGHGCLRKCICEERLSIEHVTFWASFILQKLTFPYLRFADSVDSFEILGFPLKNNQHQRTSIKNRWKPMNQWKSMEIEEIPDPQTVYQPQAISSRLQAIGCKHQYWKHVPGIWYDG